MPAKKPETPVEDPGPVVSAQEPVPEPDEISDEALPRETGVEKSGASCPNCGGEIPSVTSSYGSIVKGACPECSKDDLEAQRAAADAADA
jgi:hypothetical protein